MTLSDTVATVHRASPVTVGLHDFMTDGHSTSLDYLSPQISRHTRCDMSSSKLSSHEVRIGAKVDSGLLEALFTVLAVLARRGQKVQALLSHVVLW